jgi:hypothetical protein
MSPLPKEHPVRLKKLGTYLLLAFVAYLLFTQPAKAAGYVRTGIAGVASGVESMTAFFDTVAR